MKYITLEAFLEGHRNNAWISYIIDGRELQIYMRRSWRYDQNVRMRSIEICTISTEPKNRGNGLCTSFFEFVESNYRNWGFEVIFVESVLNNRLAKWLERRGYIQDKRFSSFELPNFRKMAKKSFQHKTIEEFRNGYVV